MAARNPTSPVDKENPVPGGSAGPVLAPVAPALGPGLIQFDQKKAPAFFADVNKDPISIHEWIQRIEHMKTSLGWTNAQTYHNAKNSLFGAAADIITTRVRVADDHEEHWDWLKKTLKTEFGQCTSSRSYVDLMFSMKPETNIRSDLNQFASKIHANFYQIEEAIPNPECNMNPAGGAYTPQETLNLLVAEKKRVVNQFAYAFIVNLLPPEVRTKVLEQKPNNISETLDKIRETRRMLIDEKRPLSTTGSHVHALNPEYENLLNEVAKMKTQLENATQNRNNQGQGRRNNQKKNNGSGTPKKCVYCNKNGHGMIDCFKRKNDKAPCYNAKGEAFYPEGEKPQANVQEDNAVYTPEANEPRPAGQKGPGFQSWV